MPKLFKVPQHDDFYCPGNGSFGRLTKRKVDWHTCRETFEGSRQTKQYLFKANEEEKANIIRFIAKVEDRIGLTKKNRLKIKLTNEPGMILIAPTKFWQGRAARSLLTILLRAGRCYARKMFPHRKDLFDATLNCEDYLADTIVAVEAFLEGRTQFKPPKRRFYGWRDTFANMNKDNVEKYLVKPKRKN